MSMLKDEIRKLAAEISPKVIEYRRHLHKHPELSFQEFETCSFVKERLNEMGIPWQAMATTGIMATLKGEKPSDQMIALRADMDALPITELNAVDYASQNAGIMHACGHDVHTASLLGTTFLLNAIKPKFGGTIRLIFQPGEEKLPGGASKMIQEGVLANPQPHAVIGQHVMPSVNVGKIGVRRGRHMASMDELYVTIHGKGGHAAMPHKNIDPVLIAAQILVALQQLVSRNANPSIPSVLSFGKVNANGATNVIPDEVRMEGTFRTLDETWRAEAHERMKKMAVGIAESLGGRCDFDIVRGYPVLVNDEQLTDAVCAIAGEYLGKENIVQQDIWMAAEDFAYYSQVSSSCFYLLGTRRGKDAVTPLHTPTFNIDEKALTTGVGLMAYLAIKQLGN